MSKTYDGGPAFPNERRDQMGLPVFAPGLSLRDYFAAHAPVPTDSMSIEEHCDFRFRYADAMLRARQP